MSQPPRVGTGGQQTTSCRLQPRAEPLHLSSHGTGCRLGGVIDGCRLSLTSSAESGPPTSEGSCSTLRSSLDRRRCTLAIAAHDGSSCHGPPDLPLVRGL